MNKSDKARSRWSSIKIPAASSKKSASLILNPANWSRGKLSKGSSVSTGSRDEFFGNGVNTINRGSTT